MAKDLVRGVRSVEIATSNLDQAAAFYRDVWNLHLQEQEANACHFRGTGRYHHIVALHAGPKPELIRVVFDVADRERLDALHRAVTAAKAGPITAIVDLAGPGGGTGFGCKDPEGRNFAFVCGAADHPGDNPPVKDRPVKVSHVNLNCADHAATSAYFTDVLGFAMSDDTDHLRFMRCGNTDHHSVVLAREPSSTLNHIAFEMPDLDSVMRGAGRMKDAGYPIEWGVGRHGAGNNVFAYFAGPDELPIEYTAEVQQVDDSHAMRGPDYWRFPPGRSDQWGVTGPRSARLLRIWTMWRFSADGWKLPVK
jgi:catechol 2,3-dioxygenase-like lactoylglutathione lyase family enzyme